jgi:hypothetical protein
VRAMTAARLVAIRGAVVEVLADGQIGATPKPFVESGATRHYAAKPGPLQWRVSATTHRKLSLHVGIEPGGHPRCSRQAASK